MAGVLRADKARFAAMATAEMGKPIVEAEGEVEKCAWTAAWIADNAARLLADEPMESTATRSFVRFQPLGGSTIDLDGLKVIYLKQPNVDLTPRVKPFAQPTGIDMPDALLPPGDHLVRIDVKDSEGRVSTTSFLLRIAP